MTAPSQTSATVRAMDAPVTATEIAAAVTQGRISARTVTEAVLTGACIPAVWVDRARRFRRR